MRCLSNLSPQALGSTWKRRWTDSEPEVTKTPRKQSSRSSRTDKQELTDSGRTLKTCSGSSRRKFRHGERKVDTGPIPSLFSYLQLIPDWRGEENPFSPMECHWLQKPHPRAGPGVSGQYKVDFMVFLCTLFLFWFSGVFVLFTKENEHEVARQEVGEVEMKWSKYIVWKKSQ